MRSGKRGIRHAVRALSLLLSLVMLSGLFPASARAELPEPTEPVEVQLDVYSSVCNSGVMEGVYFDNVFYIGMEELESFTGIRQTYYKAGDELELDAFHSQRKLIIRLDGSGSEEFRTKTVPFACPFLEYEDEPYVSLLHLLRYLDIPVTFAEDENEPVHLYITVPYTIYDAVAEYGGGMDTAFSWFEAATTQKDVENYLSKLGAAALLAHYKVGFRRCFTDTDGVEQDVLKEGITRVISEEGDDYADRLDAAQEGFNKASAALSAEVDWMGYYSDLMTDLIKAGKKAGSVKAMEFLGNAAQVGGGIANGISGLIDTITGISTYAEMTQLQSELLDNTVLSWQGGFIREDYGNFYAACENVEEAIEAANDGSVKEETLDAIIKTLQGAGEDLIGEGLLGPVAVAIKAVPTLVSMTGGPDRDADLLNAVTALAMQEYATPMYADRLAQARAADWYAGRDWRKNLKELWYDLILALKASVSARHNAIRSGQFPVDEPDMQKTNAKAAVLLRKIEQAVILEPGKTDVYTGEDLHWIKELQLPRYGNSCNNINLGGIAAYSEKHKCYVYRGDTEHRHKNGGSVFYTYDVCLEAEDGTVTVLSDSANQYPCLGIVRDWVYYLSSSSSAYSGTVHRVKMDGTGDEAVMDTDVTAFYIAFGRLFYTAWIPGTAEAGLYRSRMDGSDRIKLTELASDDNCDGIWILARDLVYYTKTSMSGGAEGFESGPTGLFRIVTEKKPGDGKPEVIETQVREGEYRMAAQMGEDLLFGDPFTGEILLYDTDTGTSSVLGKTEYYQINGDIDGFPVLNNGFDIRKAAVDRAQGVYIPGGVSLASGTNMNIAGDRIWYLEVTSGGKVKGIGWINQ